MFGFNVTQQTFSYDNRPLVPLQAMTFNQWWFHGHLDYPPHPEDIFELPAGQNVTTQVACNKGATTYYASSDGGNIQVEDQPNDVCPGAPPSEYHTTGISDVKGCALGIAYQNDISQVQPADFVIFSVNQTCVWNRYTDFSVPEKMPPCPGGKCYCAFFWIHSPDSGSEQSTHSLAPSDLSSHRPSHSVHERIPMQYRQHYFYRRSCHSKPCSSLWGRPSQRQVPRCPRQLHLWC